MWFLPAVDSSNRITRALASKAGMDLKFWGKKDSLIGIENGARSFPQIHFYFSEKSFVRFEEVVLRSD